MALNTAHFEGGVLIHQGEMILVHAPNVQLTFSGNEELKFGEKSGNAYLTTHRLIFLVGGKPSATTVFKSFSFPFVCLSEVDVEQPVFGSNFLKGKVRSQPDGGWRTEAKFKMVFKSGGAIDFAQGMVMAMRIAKQMNGQSAAWNTPPPSYTQATAPGAYQAPPAYYSAPQNTYGWMPPSYNFPAPEAGTIYVFDQPPPYPGMAPQGPPPQAPGYGYPPTQGYGYGAPPAAGFSCPPPQNGFAYANGNQAFVPPPTSASAPPSYDEANKKNN